MHNYLSIILLFIISCFQWFKDTKMKANHNQSAVYATEVSAVSNGIKDTKIKANHNVCVRVCVYLFSKDSES